MNFSNLTRDQNQYIQKQIIKAVNNTQEKLFDFGLDFEIYQILKAFIAYFINQSDIRQERVLIAVLEMILPQQNQEQQINGIVDTIYERNFAGKILWHTGEDINNIQNILSFKSLYYLCNQNQNKIQTLAEKLFFEKYQKVIIQKTNNKFQKAQTNIKKFIIYINRFPNQQLMKQQANLIKEWKFDKKVIDQLYQCLKDRPVSNQKEYAIIQLYNVYIKGNYQLTIKHQCYQLIQYLLKLSESQFQDEFNIQDDTELTIFVQLVNKLNVENINELIFKSRIAKHTECNEIYIQFSESLKLESIPDQTIIDLLDKVEQRLQYIYASDDFIIIRRISDNKVIKSMIAQKKENEIKSIIQQCMDNQLYDIIIKSQFQHKNIGQVRLRHLTYLYSGNMSSIYFDIVHTSDLVSITIQGVVLTNISKCINLQSIYSSYNTHDKYGIGQLKNLKKMRLENDQYENSQSCLLQDLITNNQLEYIHIEHYHFSSLDITKSMQLDQNIQNMRFLYIDQYYDKINIQLNVTNCYPKHMVVYNINSDHSQTIIVGSKKYMDRLKSQLIKQSKKIKI